MTDSNASAFTKATPKAQRLILVLFLLVFAVASIYLALHLAEGIVPDEQAHFIFSKVLEIFSILQSYKPLTFFGGFGLLLCIVGIIIGSFVIREYVLYQYIYSVPKAILATGFILFGVISTTIGIILHTINFRLLELSSTASRMFHFIDHSEE